MVQSIIDLGEKEDRILNIVKAKFGLKNKSQAVAFIANKYEDTFLEPEIRPEYLEKLEKIRKEGKFTRYSSFEEFEKAINKNA